MMVARAPMLKIPTPFLDLVGGGDPALLGKVTLGFEKVISKSFQPDRHPMRGKITVAEVNRRFGICERMARMLRTDLQWGWTRILDRLGDYLDCELSGKPWEPDKRSVWVPDDGR